MKDFKPIINTVSCSLNYNEQEYSEKHNKPLKPYYYDFYCTQYISITNHNKNNKIIIY